MQYNTVACQCHTLHVLNYTNSTIVNTTTIVLLYYGLCARLALCHPHMDKSLITSPLQNYYSYIITTHYHTQIELLHSSSSTQNTVIFLLNQDVKLVGARGRVSVYLQHVASVCVQCGYNIEISHFLHVLSSHFRLAGFKSIK